MTQLTDVFLNDVVLCGLVANVLDYITETVTEYNTYTPHKHASTMYVGLMATLGVYGS